MNQKQRLLVLLGLVISVVFLWFAFRDLHLEEVINNLKQVNLVWIIAGAAWFFVSLVVIARRWQFLLRAVKFVPLADLISLVMIGYMGNNVYPFRSGEALRIVLLRRSHDVPIIKSTTTVLVERVFDGVVMLTFIVVPLLFIDIVSNELRQLMTVGTPVFLIALMVFFSLAARPELLRGFVRWSSRLLPERIGQMIVGISEDIISGIEGLRSPADLFGAVVSSYASWILHAGVYWMVALAFGMNSNFWLMLMVVGAVNLAGLIPASPGQLGVFEFFASTVLVSAGVPEAQAVSYAVVVHLVIWLPVTLAGFYLLIRQGLGLTAVARASKIENQTAAG